MASCSVLSLKVANFWWVTSNKRHRWTDPQSGTWGRQWEPLQYHPTPPWRWQIMRNLASCRVPWYKKLIDLHVKGGAVTEWSARLPLARKVPGLGLLVHESGTPPQLHHCLYNLSLPTPIPPQHDHWLQDNLHLFTCIYIYTYICLLCRYWIWKYLWTRILTYAWLGDYRETYQNEAGSWKEYSNNITCL